MRTDISFSGINQTGATFEVDQATMDIIKRDYIDPRTDRIVLEGKRLAVTLKGDGLVGFGTGAATDGLFGVIDVVEKDGLASVIFEGFVEVEASATILANSKVVVNADGTVKTVADSNGRGVVVVGVNYVADEDNTGTVLI